MVMLVVVDVYKGHHQQYHQKYGTENIEILILVVLVLHHHEGPRVWFNLSCGKHRPGLAPSIVTGGTPWSACDVLIESL